MKHIGRKRDLELRKRVFALADKGHKQAAIAAEVGLSQPRISNLLKEREPSTWQAMTAAPKNKHILGAARVGVAGVWAMGVTFWSAGKWFGFTEADQPTRWMHLPTPPKK